MWHVDRESIIPNSNFIFPYLGYYVSLRKMMCINEISSLVLPSDCMMSHISEAVKR
jgi:hypothetical protein